MWWSTSSWGGGIDQPNCRHTDQIWVTDPKTDGRPALIVRKIASLTLSAWAPASTDIGITQGSQAVASSPRYFAETGSHTRQELLKGVTHY